jgi:hypothetical protein
MCQRRKRKRSVKRKRGVDNGEEEYNEEKRGEK